MSKSKDGNVERYCFVEKENMFRFQSEQREKGMRNIMSIYKGNGMHSLEKAFKSI